jgi:uncharacterized protein HemX
MASYGTPLSSIPNTSYLNASEPFSSFGGSMIDPGTATLIGTGISALGSGVGGAAAGKGAKSAAQQAREAAAEQAKQVTQANRETLLGTFGLENLAQQQSMLTGGPRERFREFEDAQFASAQAGGFGAQERARQTMAQNLAMRQADFGKSGFATPPLARFV